MHRTVLIVLIVLIRPIFSMGPNRIFRLYSSSVQSLHYILT